MKFVFTEEQLQFQETMKGFLAQECTPDSIRLGWQENKPFNTKRWEAICDLGVLGANLKEEDGGLGIDQIALTFNGRRDGVCCFARTRCRAKFSCK